jgi:hypothetical protein
LIEGVVLSLFHLIDLNRKIEDLNKHNALLQPRVNFTQELQQLAEVFIALA